MPGKASLIAALLLAVLYAAAFPAASLTAASLTQETGNATGGINNWYTLLPGQSVEWVFKYPGNNDLALIGFGVNPENSINVNVYDDGQWKDLMAGDTSVQPVGKGTSGRTYDWSWPQYQDLVKSAQLFWEAKAPRGVTFHLQISNPTQQPAQYWVAQTGPGAGQLSSAYAVPLVAQAPPSTTAGAQASATSRSTVPAPAYLPVSGGSPVNWFLVAAALLLSAAWLLRCRLLADPR